MFYPERQITFDKPNHQLTNINVWTPDSHWSASFTGLIIEEVNIETL